MCAKSEVIKLICSKCSNKIEDDSLFCSICGSDLRKKVRQAPIVDDQYLIDKDMKGDNETKQIPFSNNTSIITNLSWVSIIIAIIACILFFISAEQISKVANDMIDLRSQAGTSLAEVYYQDIGKALKGFAMFARALGISIVAITIATIIKEHKL